MITAHIYEATIVARTQQRCIIHQVLQVLLIMRTKMKAMSKSLPHFLSIPLTKVDLHSSSYQSALLSNQLWLLYDIFRLIINIWPGDQGCAICFPYNISSIQQRRWPQKRNRVTVHRSLMICQRHTPSLKVKQTHTQHYFIRLILHDFESWLCFPKLFNHMARYASMFRPFWNLLNY